jgi:hypothetical protein
MANQESTATGTFVVPVKCIKDEAKDMPFFQASEGYARVLSYILALNTAVLNRKVSDPLPESEVRPSSLSLSLFSDSAVYHHKCVFSMGQGSNIHCGHSD